MKPSCSSSQTSSHQKEEHTPGHLLLRRARQRASHGHFVRVCRRLGMDHLNVQKRLARRHRIHRTLEALAHERLMALERREARALPKRGCDRLWGMTKRFTRETRSTAAARHARRIQMAYSSSMDTDAAWRRIRRREERHRRAARRRRVQARDEHHPHRHHRRIRQAQKRESVYEETSQHRPHRARAHTADALGGEWLREQKRSEREPVEMVDGRSEAHRAGDGKNRCAAHQKRSSNESRVGCLRNDAMRSCVRATCSTRRQTSCPHRGSTSSVICRWLR